MSNFSKFLKENKIKKQNTKCKVTKSLVDENGEVLDWEVKAITTKENDVLRDSCTRDIQIPGKPGQYRQKLEISKYINKLICAAVVNPNLNDKELQESYGVMSAEELIVEMVDDPGEYAEFAQFIQTFNGFETLEEKVEEAKN